MLVACAVGPVGLPIAGADAVAGVLGLPAQADVSELAGEPCTFAARATTAAEWRELRQRRRLVAPLVPAPSFGVEQVLLVGCGGGAPATARWTEEEGVLVLEVALVAAEGPRALLLRLPRLGQQIAVVVRGPGEVPERTIVVWPGL